MLHPPQRKGNDNLGWILGISAMAGVALIAVNALVFFLAMSGSSSGPNASSDVSNNMASVDSQRQEGNSEKQTGLGSIRDLFTDSSKQSSSGVSSWGSGSFGPTIPFGEQPAFQASLADTRYKLNIGEDFAISYEYAAEIGATTSILRGSVTYTASNRSASEVVSDQEDLEEGEGNGTGFVVRPDGYIVTNAHVVQGTTLIEAHLDGKVYPAKVVAMDAKNDLAIIRIDATNLPHLTIHDSEKVRLAEEVRAFGFPMVDRLGESIKITRGTISGMPEEAGSKMFQLDVTVNPGNSGGPLVNDRGQVVGVITALMAGDDIADMSFAVTSNNVRRLLKRNKLDFEPSNEKTKVMSGPDLAEQVRRSVALLKVKVGPGGLGIAEKKVIEYRLTWSAENENRGILDPRSMQSGYESGVILMSPSGEVAYCDGKKSLPAHLGLVATLGLQPLSDDDSTTWHSARLTAVPETRSIEVPNSEPSGYPPGRYSPYGRRYGRRPGTTTIKGVKLHPAIEVTKFEILNSTGDILNIKKRQELFTIDDEESPYLRVSGTGSFQFDKGKGLPSSLDIDGSVIGRSSQVPFKLKFNLANAEELAKNQSKAVESMKQAQAEVGRKRAEEDAKKNIRRIDAETISVSQGLTELDLSE